MKEELENIDDNYLKNLKSDGGFETPASYFELSKSSILNKINPEASFSVPFGYFETNKAEILKKTNIKGANKTTLFPFFNWQITSGIAAIFIAIITIYVFKNSKKSDELNVSLNTISEVEMIEYLANNDVKVEWINEFSTNSKSTLKEEEKNIEIVQYLLEHTDEQALLDEL
jgi:hypothetical protein